MENKPSSGRLAFKILNNTLAFIGGDFFYHFVNFFAGILVARSLGGEAYGQFSFVFAFLSFFEIFVQFGMNSILTREVAQNKEEAPCILGNAILLRLMLTGLALPAAFILIQGMGYPPSVKQGVWIASFQLFLALRSVYEIIFRVNLSMIYPALWNGLRAVVNLVLVGGVAYFRPGVLTFILAYLVSGAIGLSGLVFTSRRFVRIEFRWNGAWIKRLLKESFPLILSGYLTLLYYRVDIFMLSVMKGFREIGYYSVATRLTESLDIVAISLMISLSPVLAAAFKDDRAQFERVLARTLEILLLIGLPMALGGSLVAEDLITFLFGAEFASSGITLKILFWYTFFGFFTTFLVNLLIVCGRQTVDAWISLFLVAANIGMNLLLIPAYSYNGAAAATVLTEVFGMTAMMIYAARHPMIRLPLSPASMVNAFKVNALFLGVLLLVKSFLHLHVLGFVFLGILIYPLLLLAFKIVSPAEMKSYLVEGFLPSLRGPAKAVIARRGGSVSSARGRISLWLRRTRRRSK